MKQYFLLSCLAVIAAACNNAGNSNADSNNKDTIKQTATTMDTGTIKSENIDYSGAGTAFKSYVAYKDDGKTKPVVLVVPEWWGVNDYTRSRVHQLADLGYVAMAVDMYGNGKTAETPDSAGACAMPFYKDAALAKAHFDAALAKAKTLPQADTSKIAAIGYCFGGGMVLNMARLGEPLKGVVSFHGSLMGGITAKKGDVKSKILALHGADDSMVPATDVQKFKTEMQSAGVDYTFIPYAGAKHAFTNPGATAIGQKYKLDIAYNAAADTASWKEMRGFLEKAFK